MNKEMQAFIVLSVVIILMIIVSIYTPFITNHVKVNVFIFSIDERLVVRLIDFINSENLFYSLTPIVLSCISILCLIIGNVILLSIKKISSHKHQLLTHRLMFLTVLLTSFFMISSVLVGLYTLMNTSGDVTGRKEQVQNFGGTIETSIGISVYILLFSLIIFWILLICIRKNTPKNPYIKK